MRRLLRQKVTLGHVFVLVAIVGLWITYLRTRPINPLSFPIRCRGMLTDVIYRSRTKTGIWPLRRAELSSPLPEELQARTWDIHFLGQDPSPYVEDGIRYEVIRAGYKSIQLSIKTPKPSK